MDRSGVGRASQRSFASSMGRRGADSLQPLARGRAAEEQDAWEGAQLAAMLEVAQQKYDEGLVLDAKKLCEAIYQVRAPPRTPRTPPDRGRCRWAQVDATWTDNLILLSAIHFALREHSESMFYCQQAIRVRAASGGSGSGEAGPFLTPRPPPAAEQVDPGAAEAYSNLGAPLTARLSAHQPRPEVIARRRRRPGRQCAQGSRRCGRRHSGVPEGHPAEGARRHHAAARESGTGAPRRRPASARTLNF